jgi:hypothetical protein
VESPDRNERVIVEEWELPGNRHREDSIRTRQVSEEKYSKAAFINWWRNIHAGILNLPVINR